MGEREKDGKITLSPFKLDAMRCSRTTKERKSLTPIRLFSD